MRNLKTWGVVGALVLGAGIVVAAVANNQARTTSQHGHEAMPPTAQPVDTPQVEVKVNKEYDDQGNLIRFDSTYTKVYSSLGGDSLLIDSLMQGFMQHFQGMGAWGMDQGFNDLFFRDSLLHYDFFHDDFFRQRLQLNQDYLEDMMQRMDSLKNRYFNEQEQGARPKDIW